MGVGIRVGNIVDELGSGSFVHAFFSTVSAHCEPKGWGSRFPALMQLYKGKLPAGLVEPAIGELRDAKRELSELAPSQVVWDIEDRKAQPPWGANISPSITSLGNYFVTSAGRDLFGVLEEALRDALDNESGARLE
jgi:hypothetical protein